MQSGGRPEARWVCTAQAEGRPSVQGVRNVEFSREDSRLWMALIRYQTSDWQLTDSLGHGQELFRTTCITLFPERAHDGNRGAAWAELVNHWLVSGHMHCAARHGLCPVFESSSKET